MYKSIMERTQIYLSAEETDALDRIAAERGVTRSHLIREAIHARYVYARESQRMRMLAVIDQLGGPWEGRSDITDGETYVERSRGRAGR